MSEVIDRKFQFLASNPCKPEKVYTEANAIVFCAKDKAVPAMLLAYMQQCKRIACGQEHIESINLLIGRVIDYQRDIECRVPDTETDCEIDRCIGGKV